MTMSNLHPGFILIAVGLIALFVPKSLRRPVLAAGPLLGLGAVLTLAPGTNATLPFINGITLHYLHVDAILPLVKNGQEHQEDHLPLHE